MPGAVYVPFIGDGDIAAALYADREVYGADIDPARVATASGRLAGSIVVADCDKWPPQFAGLDTVFAVADFDAYAYPYDAFRAWWANARKADRVAVFFTDGQRQACKRSARWHDPDGREMGDGNPSNTAGFRPYFNAWWSKVVAPWIEAATAGWSIVATDKYQRRDMLYWGAVLARGVEPAPTERDQKGATKGAATPMQRAYADARNAGKNQAESARVAGYKSGCRTAPIEAACIKLGILPDPQTATDAIRQTVREIEAIRAAARRAVIEALDARKAEIVAALIEAAESGNVPAIKESLDRLLPAEAPRAPVDEQGNTAKTIEVVLDLSAATPRRADPEPEP